jgi:hypothetical protein
MPAQTGTIYTVGSDCLDPATGLQHFLNVAVPGDTIEIPRPPQTVTVNSPRLTDSVRSNWKVYPTTLSRSPVMAMPMARSCVGRLVRHADRHSRGHRLFRNRRDREHIPTFPDAEWKRGADDRHQSPDARDGLAAGGDWVVVKTAKPDSELPPEGVRVDPSWAGKLALLTSTETGHAATAPSLAFGILAHHYRFVGLELTHSQTAAPGAFDPLDHAPYAITTADTSYVIFDRCYFHGLASRIGFGTGFITGTGHIWALSIHTPIIKTTGGRIQRVSPSRITRPL